MKNVITNQQNTASGFPTAPPTRVCRESGFQKSLSECSMTRNDVAAARVCFPSANFSSRSHWFV